MAEVLNTEERTETGTKRMRRLRRAGFTPAVLYGAGGGKSESLSISTKQVDAAIRHGSQVVKLTGKVSTDALIKDIQWDAFGSEVLHLDFTSIDLTEAITVSLSVELVGEAPGVKVGGVVKQMMQDMEIECAANALPDKLEVKINDLELNQSITVGDVELPDGAKPTCELGDVVVTCVEPSAATVEDEDEAGTPSEPEVIGRKEEDEGEG